MYTEYYDFSAEPFRVTPDPAFLYLTDQYKEALAAIIYGIAKRKGFVCISGEVGVGKTTLLRAYLESVNEPELLFVYVYNPNVSFQTLLRHVFKEVGLDYVGDDIAGMVDALRLWLIQRHAGHETLVLLIDEAQNMPIGTLESLRMLTNLETAKEKLVQIVLVGQPELETLLAARQLRQLESRIAVRTRLGPLSRAEAASYIRHRLRLVTHEGAPVLSDGAISEIARLSGGIPRRVNVMADTVLRAGFKQKLRPVPARVVREVARDLRLKEGRPAKNWLWWTGVGLGGAVVAGLAAAVALWPKALPPVPQISDQMTAQKLPPAVGAVAGGGYSNSAPTLPSEAQMATVQAIPAPGDSVSRVPASGVQAPGVSVSGVPASGNPASGVQAPGVSVSGVPASGNPASGAQTPGVSVSGVPASGSGVPASTILPTGFNPAQPEAQSRVLRIVAPGDTLAGLTFQVYGRMDRASLDRVQARNPAIINVDRIQVGQVIEFPALETTPFALR